MHRKVYAHAADCGDEAVGALHNLYLVLVLQEYLICTHLEYNTFQIPSENVISIFNMLDTSPLEYGSI